MTSGAERILILAPRGRDAEVTEQVLRRGGAECRICSDLADVRACLDGDIGGVLVTEEALVGADLEPLLEWCESQPPWSDLPVIVLATKQVGRRSEQAARVLDRLGNVVLLERPINAETLISAATSALRARRRQHQARALLEAQDAAARELRQLNENLEQRVAERTSELEGARETLAFALDSAGMGSWDLDLTSDNARRSPQHDRIFGYDQMLPGWGRDIFLTHVVDEDRAAAAAAFDQAAESGSLDLECRIRRPDGAVRWVVARGRVEYEADGRPFRMAGVLMDSTERRQTEDALRQAQKMEAIGQLTGGVAHDFNNLLTVIVGGLDMVIRRPEQTDRVVRLADAAMTAARRGEQLTQQLLAFSRRQVLRPQTLDPNKLLTNFEALAQRAAGETVRLQFDLDPAAAPIRIDAAQFEAAVLNLIVNSRDAMPGGGVITVQTRNLTSSGGPAAETGACAGSEVMVAVRDTGAGFDPAALSRAFEPFFTTKEVGKGSGLGLAQVYGFTRSAGGDVAIESTPGEGTVVKLFFPASSDAAVEDRSLDARNTPLPRAARGETVLLVEDDEQVLDMATESLDELSYKVMIARNAQEALAYLHGPERIDVLFSDVMMPGSMNGAELAVEARRLRPELKVLLTSGYVGEFGAGQVISEDLTLLSKPYRRDELADKLRLVLAED